MEVSFVISLCVGLLGFFVGGFAGFIDTRNSLRDFANFSEREDVSDDEEEPKEPQPDYKAEVDRLRKLLTEATDNANRLAAMNEGLTEDLAALKAYDPEEVEERLKKIREIRADEEHNERMKREAELFRLWAAQSLMSSQYCSLGAASQIPFQSPLNIRVTPDGHFIGGYGL